MHDDGIRDIYIRAITCSKFQREMQSYIEHFPASYVTRMGNNSRCMVHFPYDRDETAFGRGEVKVEQAEMQESINGKR